MADQVIISNEEIAADILIASIEKGLFDVGNDDDKIEVAKQISEWYKIIKESI